MGVTPDPRPRPKPKSAAELAREEAAVKAAGRRRRLWMMVIAAAALVAAALVGVNLVSFRGNPEGDAVAALVAVNTAQFVYSAQHPERGYAPSLSELGPGAANLIPGALAQGSTAGYRFEITPGERDENGRLVGYTLVARPLAFGSSARRSYLTNQSGGIRWTEENRAPTLDDPPVEGAPGPPGAQPAQAAPAAQPAPVPAQ